MYKLTYFDREGRAEIIRLIFVFESIDFEDIRLPWPPQNAELLQELPIVETPDNTVVSGQLSEKVAMWLALKFDLAGKTELAQLKCRQFSDALYQGLYAYLKGYYSGNKSAAEKKEQWKRFVEDQLPSFMKSCEKDLHGCVFLCDNEITWIDIAVAHSLWHFANLEPSLRKLPYPKLWAMVDKIMTEPKIADYVASRPKTEF